MTPNNARVYIKVGNTEFTIEGNPVFVSHQVQHTLKFFDSKSTTTSTAPKKQKNESESTKTKSKEKKSPKTTTKPTIQNHNQITDAIGNDFKDWLIQLPTSHETRDKILVAAYFSQINNKDQRFYMPDIK